MGGQADMGSINEPEFSRILATLSGSPMGRAFLAEYRRRGRPDETTTLLQSLGRIEATIGTVRDQLQPERIADELQRVAMTLEIAIEGADINPEGDEAARRMALVDRVRRELTVLAASLSEEASTAARDPAEANELLRSDGLALHD